MSKKTEKTKKDPLVSEGGSKPTTKDPGQRTEIRQQPEQSQAPDKSTQLTGGSDPPPNKEVGRVETRR